jgi:hypothetical protein
MCAYEFYWFDKTEKPHFIGILKEKREDLLRITRESVLNLGRKVIGDNAEATNIYFIQVEVEEPL